MQGYIGLGSNLGDPVFELREGASLLESRGVEILHRSSFYRTEPVDAPNSGWFVNAVAAIRFPGGPLELLENCLAVEAKRGRKRILKNEPRTLDLDLLLLDDTVLEDDNLTVPHPRLHERRFVLVPMVEIAPDVVHPVMKKTMRELLAACPDEARVFLMEDAFA